eukprot:GHVU01092199.1.p1 GENE.GHVU01092199.1~~GHVU01092199.1.p1  ORF type:complete len:100 (+),score=4.98 GHVU01092199.1:586-885(+)
MLSLSQMAAQQSRTLKTPQHHYTNADVKAQLARHTQNSALAASFGGTWDPNKPRRWLVGHSTAQTDRRWLVLRFGADVAPLEPSTRPQCPLAPRIPRRQ